VSRRSSSTPTGLPLPDGSLQSRHVGFDKAGLSFGRATAGFGARSLIVILPSPPRLVAAAPAAGGPPLGRRRRRSARVSCCSCFLGHSSDGRSVWPGSPSADGGDAHPRVQLTLPRSSARRTSGMDLPHRR
jgi:hypothetical protein